MRNKIRRFFKALADEYVFPEGIYCIACGAFIDKSRNYALCDDCMEAFRWIRENECPVCGRPVQSAFGVQGAAAGVRRCRDCTERPKTFEKGFSCFVYGEREKKPVLDLKYGGDTYLARKLAEIMADRLRTEIAERDGEIFFDIMLPVPIHESRLRERGFNQAELLARFLSKEIGVEHDAGTLVRTKATKKMHGLERSERALNIEGAFAVASGNELKIQSKRILLIDDIFTTGSTAEEAARVLKEHGAKEVYVITAAAGAT